MSENSNPSNWFEVIFIKGLLISGGQFAILMTIGHYIIDIYFENRFDVYSYLTSLRTWVNFLFYFLFFGISIGVADWTRNREKS